MESARVFFDIETGGFDADVHPVIQVAAVAVRTTDLAERERFQMRVQFDPSTCSLEALQINRYDEALWRTTAVPPREAVVAFGEFLRRHATVKMVSQRTGNPYYLARLAGHNAAQFDAPFWRTWAKRVATTYFHQAELRVLDTMHLAMWYADTVGTQPESFKLGALCEWLGIPHAEAHDAMGDVLATLELARRLRSAMTSAVAAETTP